MKPSEILDATATHIEKYGWARRKYVADGIPKPASRCPVCPRGGMSVAVGHGPTFAADYAAEIADEADRQAYAEVSAAEAAFAEYLRRGGLTLLDLPDVLAIEWWNDRRAKSDREVVDELRKCAAELRAGGR